MVAAGAGAGAVAVVVAVVEQTLGTYGIPCAVVASHEQTANNGAVADVA